MEIQYRTLNHNRYPIELRSFIHCCIGIPIVFVGKHNRKPFKYLLKINWNSLNIYKSYSYDESFEFCRRNVVKSSFTEIIMVLIRKTKLIYYPISESKEFDYWNMHSKFEFQITPCFILLHCCADQMVIWSLHS